MEYRKLTELAKLPNNPRTIKDASFKSLCKSIQDNPDYFEARPVILSDRTGELIIIAGNQRYEAAKHLKLSTIPTHLLTGLTEEREREIIIRDNVANGEWDLELLKDWDKVKLDEWGVVLNIEEEIDNMNEGEEIEVQQSVQLEPPKEYILIMADPNSEEWEELKQMLKLKMVRRGGYKKGSSFDSVGIERVLLFNDFKERLNVNSNTE